MTLFPFYAIKTYLTGIHCAWLQAKKYPLKYRPRFMRRYLRMSRRKQSCLLAALSEPTSMPWKWKHFLVIVDDDGIPVEGFRRNNAVYLAGLN